MIGWQDPDRAKVQLLWTSAYSSPVHSLSRNLLREICLYLGHYEVYVPAISQHLFRIFNVKSRTVRELYLDVIFSSGAVFCFTRGLEVIVVGGWPAVEDVYTVNEGKAVRQVSMSTARGWPGIYYWEGRLYVFGGNNPPICSCCCKACIPNTANNTATTLAMIYGGNQLATNTPKETAKVFNTTAATKPATKANHCAMTPCGAKV